MSDDSEKVDRLEALVNRLMARMAHLEDSRGRMFIADEANAGSTNRAITEMIPKADGSELQTLEDGRTVSGSTDPGVFLQIPGLKSGQTVMMGFALGENTAYVKISSQLCFGKVVTVADCHAYCIAKPCKRDGTLLSDRLVTIFPTFGSCDSTSSGFCFVVGTVVAYEEAPGEPDVGFQLGQYKRMSMGYQCGEAEGGPTNLAHVNDFNRIEPYLTDFKIGASSDCGSYTNLAQLNWRGFMVTGGYQGNPGTSLAGANFIGSTNTASTGGVKVLSFDGNTANSASLSSYPGTNGAKIQFEVTGFDTTANRPTLGGSPCIDNSLPKVAQVVGFFPVGKTIDASADLSSSITAVFNEDCTITITWNPPTMRAVVPF